MVGLLLEGGPRSVRGLRGTGGGREGLHTLPPLQVVQDRYDGPWLEACILQTSSECLVVGTLQHRVLEGRSEGEKEGVKEGKRESLT